MTEELVLSQQVGVVIAREIDGLEMGVLTDGRSYLTARGLAKLCGVVPSAIMGQGKRWLDGSRDGKLAHMLVARGIQLHSLYIDVERPDVIGGKVNAYTDDICMVILEYYAFESTPISGVAQANFRRLARAGLRVFIYQALGYDPRNRVPEKWKQFHDRLTTHALPYGYFSVFREMSEFVLNIIRVGLEIDAGTVPDISVGQQWSKHWDENSLSATYGERKKHDHNYPDYFPQAASNPQAMWVYPVDALGEFRRWFDGVYLPTKFPKYLKGRVSRGALPASVAEMLAAEVVPALPPPGADDE